MTKFLFCDVTILLFNVIILSSSFPVPVIWVSFRVALISFNVKCNMLVCLSKIVPVVCTTSNSIKIYQLEELMMLNSVTSMEVYFLPSPTIMVLLGATTQTLSSTN